MRKLFSLAKFVHQSGNRIGGMQRIQRLAISDEGFVFDPTTGESFRVNYTGLAILKALKEGLSPEEIVERLVQQFEVSYEEASRDTMDFIEHMRSYHLV